MKRFYIVWVLLLSIQILFSQNYQSVYSNRTSCFLKGNNLTSFIRVDSVKFQADSVFYLPKGIISETGNKIKLGCSWIGDKVIIKPNGDNIFFNLKSDSILIKTQAKLNDSWLVSGQKSNLNIFGQVIKHDTLSFLGIVDSVKTIGFKVFNNAMKPVDMELNNFTILLSKNYGLVKTLNFKLFPDLNDWEMFTQVSLNEYPLIGLSHPKTGIQNMTWFDVYDFQVGDELHTLSEESDFMSPNASVVKKNKLKCLARYNYIDSIIYTIDNEEEQVLGKTNPTHTYKHDTINLIVRSNSDFDKLPGEPIILGNLPTYLFQNYMTRDTRPVKYKNDRDLYSNFSDTVWSYIPVDGCFPVYEYKKGLGGPYYECTGISGDYRLCELVYYRKDIETWGTPLVITALPQKVIPNVSKINVYYSAKSLHIRVNPNFLPCSFELYDISGRLMKKIEIRSTETVVNTNNLKGIYFYIANSKKQILGTGKLMLQ